MAIIKGVLKEELENSKRLKKRYDEELRKLPKGSLMAKKIKKGIYYYLQYRDGGKRHLKYLGKLSSAEVTEYKDRQKLRARYKKLLSDVKKQLKFLKKAVNAKSI